MAHTQCISRCEAVLHSFGVPGAASERLRTLLRPHTKAARTLPSCTGSPGSFYKADERLLRVSAYLRDPLNIATGPGSPLQPQLGLCTAIDNVRHQTTHLCFAHSRALACGEQPQVAFAWKTQEQLHQLKQKSVRFAYGTVDRVG